MNDTTDASAIFGPIWKRKWLILIVAVLVGAATYAYYKRQATVYSASTELNLASGAEEQSLLSASKATTGKAAIANAASIISSSVVAEQAHRILRAEHAKAGKGKVRAKASATGSDIVTITAEAHGAKAAARVANAYATAYIAREHAAYLKAVEKAIHNTRQQLRRVEQAASSAAHRTSKGASTVDGAAVIQAASLNSKLNQFESELSLQGIQQISPAKSSSAELVEPKPKKNAIFGFAFGLLLAAVAAFIAERFDRSLRSLTSIEQASEEPILAALPSVKSPIAHIDGQPVLSAPLLEPVRRVQSTLRLREAAVDGAGERANVLVCTSADAGDGKSTLVAALALVMREAGQRVAVVEADFRRPVLAKLLNVGGDLGLADVLAGSVSVEDALQAVPGSNASVSAHESAGGGSATAVRSRTRGSISVLIGAAPGERPPSLAGGAMSELLGSLAEDFDSVLIDAPSPLEASDTISLLSEVDGIVVVARVRHTRDVSSQRLADLVSLPSTAPVLGIVVNDVSPRELQRSGLSAGHGQRGWPSSLAGR